TDDVCALAFSPDGKQIASGSADGTLRLWDVATGKELRQFGAPALPVVAVRFSPDAKSLFCARPLPPRQGNREDVPLAVEGWDLAGGNRLRLFTGPSEPSWRWLSEAASLALSRDGKILVAASATGNVKGWQLPSGAELFEHRESQACLTLSPNGDVFALG